jgi:HAD superfamily hydrolase (TIGR01549 family)
MNAIDSAIVDVDGTLVDSNYQQVLAWSRAFAELRVPVELWQLHQHMGMGGDRLVSAVAGEAIEECLGDDLREQWRRHYDDLISEVRPVDGADELLDGLAARALSVVIASSGKPEHTDRAMKLVGIDGRFPTTDAEDADATKPAPDLVSVAVNKVEGTRAVMIGDTVWDVKAAARCGYPTIALLTGGIARSTLREAGAVVFESPRDLLNHLDDALEAAAQAATIPKRHLSSS